VPSPGRGSFLITHYLVCFLFFPEHPEQRIKKMYEKGIKKARGVSKMEK
jgi:hypothetical protein